MSKPFYVSGEWRKSDDVCESRSPYDGSLIDTFFVPSADDAADAVAGAARVHAAGPPPRHERAEWLRRAADLVRDRAGALTDVLVEEGGKPLSAARGEVARVESTLRWSSEEARRLDGELLPLDTAAAYGDRAGLVTRVPVGPVLGITPFNYPLNLVAHKVGPALAVGAPIIVKPATSTALAGHAFADVLHDAGVPAGYVSMLPMSGSATSVLVDDPRIAKISFTGSSEVGWGLRARAPKARVTLELGGNAAVIVTADADLTFAAERIAWGAFAQAGQSCISAQRVYVEAAVHTRFVEELVRRAEALTVGDPSDERTDVGPLITSRETDRVEAWVQDAVAAGARVLAGGTREHGVYRPTVLTDVAPSSSVWCEEVFGPVVSVVPFDDYDEALRDVNSSRFGLQAAVFTNDLARAFRAFSVLEVGGVVINDVATWRADEMPYGGVKDSGTGREGIRYAIAEMTEPRLLVLNGIRI